MAETYSKDELTRRMHGAIETLKKEFSGLRTGRASPALLDPVRVEAYGNLVPVNQVGNISTPESRMLTVQVWDKGLAKGGRQGDPGRQSGPQSADGRAVAAHSITRT